MHKQTLPLSPSLLHLFHFSSSAQPAPSALLPPPPPHQPPPFAPHLVPVVRSAPALLPYFFLLAVHSIPPLSLRWPTTAVCTRVTRL